METNTGNDTTHVTKHYLWVQVLSFFCTAENGPLRLTACIFVMGYMDQFFMNFIVLIQRHFLPERIC